MKKVLALLLVAVAFAAPSQAQVKFGVKGGLNLTELSLSNDAVENAISNNAGFFIGPTVKFTVPIVGLSLDAAALYDQRSTEVKATDQTLKQQTVQVPINVRYGIGLSSLVNLYAYLGPQFGFNLGDKATDIKSTTETVGSWRLKESNLSGNIGLGATILNHLQLSVNYNIAFGKTGEFDVLETATQTALQQTGLDGLFGSKKSNAKSNSWQVAVAYYF